MVVNQNNSDIVTLEKSYKELYAYIEAEYHRIDIVERVKEYQALTEIVLPTESELAQIQAIQKILGQWVDRKDIDELHNIYETLKSQGIKVKSPDRFLVGPQR